MNLHVIDDQWTADGDGEQLPALLELPVVHAGRSAPKIDTSMAQPLRRPRETSFLGDREKR
jgi:hypothetical protein